MDKIKVIIIESPFGGNVSRAFHNADIVISAYPTISKSDKGKLELCSENLYAISPKIVRILSQVECVISTTLLGDSSGITLLLTKRATETNDLLESLREVFGDLEIST